MKNILIVNHYGQQPPYNTMLRHHNWAKELVKRGYKVTVISASTIHNTKIDMIEQLGQEKTTVDGILYKYKRTPKYSGNGIKRMLNLLSFCFSIIYGKKENADIIISAGAYIYPFMRRKYKNTPIITDIADLWPQSIIEYADFSPNNPLIKYLYHLEKKAYLKSDALLFSMEGGIDYVKEQKYANKIDLSKIFHINMGCDIQQKDRELKGISFDLGWNPDEFNVVYCGSVRQANQVKQICDAAKIMKERGYKDIKFQVYGNGNDLKMLKKYVVDNSIDNVHFYGRIEKAKIPFILSHAKANILTYKHVPLMKYGGSQSKLFDYLASGKPVICNAKFGYNLIERYNCGVVAEDQSAQALADAIEKVYKTNTAELAEMGKRARKTAEMYDQPILVDKLEEVFAYVNNKKT
nr:glycosyltransferase family 4 protein [uncultured Acetatifactor sp.]